MGAGAEGTGKASTDGGTRVSGCTDGVGAVADGGADGVGAVVDGGGSADGVGTVAEGGMAHTRARAFAAADVTSGFAHLPDRSPPV